MRGCYRVFMHHHARPLLVLCAALMGCPTSTPEGESSSSSSGGSVASSSGGGTVSSSGTQASSSAAACLTCMSDADCGAGHCAQLAVGNFCFPACDAQACAGGAHCTELTGPGGNTIHGCLAGANPCGACATACTGTDVCNPETGACEAPVAPSSSSGPVATSSSSAVTVSSSAAGASSTTSATSMSGTGGCNVGAAPNQRPWTGSVNAQGGTVSHLVFGVEGDSRPAIPTFSAAGYPTDKVNGIFTGMNTLAVKPQFVTTTGDHSFAFATSNGASEQLDIFLRASAILGAPLFPAMGNHECFLSTSSNCGPGTNDANNNNFNTFVAKLLAPIGKDKPYYRVNINHAGGAWTAKFVYVASNSWTTAQGTWLEQQMADPTTYTFVVRHTPADATGAPGTSPSEAIIRAHPYTLAIVGHTHKYERSGPREVIVGHGGAPPSGTTRYGYALVQMLENGDIQVDNIDYTTNKSVDCFTVTP